MSAVLGVSAHYHDAAAALVVDGEVACAVQEERLSRTKNDPSLPRRAALACLARAGLAGRDLDRVVYYENPYARLERVLVSLLREFPRSWRQFPRAIGAQLGNKIWVLDDLAELLDVPRAKVVFGEHHRSHAASAFFASGAERAAVLTVDGVGEEVSTAIWRGEGGTLTPLVSLAFPHSLGLLYAAFTAYLGFEVNEGEYKVMGLAAFGEPRFRDELARVLRVSRDGSYELDLDYFAYATDVDLGFSRKLEALLGPRRAPRAPWDLARDDDRRYADVAASLQAATEDALLALARRARSETGADTLCLAGGVALNAVANARIARDVGFARVFVQPAAGDAGGALGAAMLDAGPVAPPRTAALGLDVSAAEALDLARELGLRATTLDAPFVAIAERLAKGDVVAVAQGRFEWGPRALGQRSILASPRSKETRDRINRLIKRREPFRPFAPSVIEDRAADFFDGAPNAMTPFMTTVCPVNESRASELGAVTHVDGTARVQTVTRAVAPELFAILEEVNARTGLPVVLNTSLNGAGEPICASACDAVTFFLSHAVDALFVGDVLVERAKG